MPRTNRTTASILTATLCAALAMGATDGTTLSATPSDGEVVWSWDAVGGAVAYELMGEGGVAIRTTDTQLVTPAVNGSSQLHTVRALGATGTVLATDALAAAGADMTPPDVSGVLASIHPGEGAGALVQVTVPSNVTDVDHVRVTVDGALHGRHAVAPGQTVQFHVATDDASGSTRRWVELALADLQGNVSRMLGVVGGTEARTGEHRTPPPPVGFDAAACTASGAVVAMEQPGGANAIIIYRHDLATGKTDGVSVARTTTSTVTLPLGSYIARSLIDGLSVPSTPFTVVSKDGVCGVTATTPAWELVATAAVSPGATIAEVVDEADRHLAPLQVAAVNPQAPTGVGMVDSRAGWAQRSAARTLAGVEVLVNGAVVRTQGLLGADDWQTTVPVDPTWVGDVTVRWISLHGVRGPATAVAMPAAPVRVAAAPSVSDARIDGGRLLLTLDDLDAAATQLQVRVDGVVHAVAPGSVVEVPLTASVARRTLVVSVAQQAGGATSARSAPVVVTG